MSNNDSDRRRTPRSDWAGLAIVAVLFVLMAALSWRKWADVVVDFGAQLYVPWRLSQGDILYRDVMYLPGGPLSQYFNALLFKIFGVSFRTLIFANLTITAALLVLIYRRFLAAADRWTATTICSAIVVGFAFADYGDRNYNYIAPYCHEAFHGLALSILAIVLFSDGIQKRNWKRIAGAGFCCGLVFLTKPEIFLALGATSATAFFLIFKSEPVFPVKMLWSFLAAALAPLLGFFFYFLHLENVAEAFRSVTFAWLPVLGTSVAGGVYYKWCLGLDHPLANLGKMLEQFFFIAALTALYAAFFRKKINGARDRILMLALCVPLLALVSGLDWTVLPSLPLISLTLCVLLWSDVKKISAERAPAFSLLWSVFALALLAKMGLNARLWHYGFVLGMPAFVGAIFLLLWLLPLRLEKFGVQRIFFRRFVWAILMFGCMRLFMQSEVNHRQKTFSVGENGDEIRTFDAAIDPRGAAIAPAMAWLQTNAPSRATLTVLPEGALINYLCRRVNPTGYPVWLPPEIQVFGQSNMIAAFRRRSPDYVLLMQHPTAEYGVKPFGEQADFGLELMEWVGKNYDLVFQAGAAPLDGPNFGLQILKRRPAISDFK
jgi:Dolichyl-phosphate-mannose-protein mannosyltransferase